MSDSSRRAAGGPVRLNKPADSKALPVEPSAQPVTDSTASSAGTTAPTVDSPATVADPGGEAAAEAVHVPMPLSVKAALGAVIAYVVFTLARSLALLLGSSDRLEAWLVYLNGKAKHPNTNFDAAAALHSQRVGSLQVAIVVGAALLILAYMVRRPRQASLARWALIGLLVITVPMTSGPFAIVPQKRLPASLAVPWVLTGVAWIAVVVLLLVPQSTGYFRTCKRLTNPGRPAGRSGGGLGALFAPRGPAGAKTPPPAPARGRRPASAAGATRRTDPATSQPAKATPRSAAKVRAEEPAARPNRPRPKASKSRRTEP